MRQSDYDDTVTIEADLPKDWSGAYEGAIKAFGITREGKGFIKRIISEETKRNPSQ